MKLQKTTLNYANLLIIMSEDDSIPGVFSKKRHLSISTILLLKLLFLISRTFPLLFENMESIIETYGLVLGYCPFYSKTETIDSILF